MRSTPKPRFHYDELVEKGPAMEALIRSALNEDESRRAAAGTDEDAENDE